jgi:hypothetical protein
MRRFPPVQGNNLPKMPVGRANRAWQLEAHLGNDLLCTLKKAGWPGVFIRIHARERKIAQPGTVEKTAERAG